MNGTKHTPDMIQDLWDTGVWMRRYRKWVGANTYKGKDIQDGLEEWRDKWYHLDDNIHGRLGGSSARQVFATNLPNAPYLVDVVDHNVKGRKRPGQKHDCDPVMSSRGDVSTLITTLIK